MMASAKDVILAEGFLLHKSTRQTGLCQQKKYWWQSPLEAKGCLVQRNENNYKIDFEYQKKKSCSHNLPVAGNAVILRHATSNNLKSLFIAEVKHQCCPTVKDSPTLTLSFKDSTDLKKWESELRSKLKVYSFQVQILENQLIGEGPATVHITQKYLCITKNGVGNNFKALYCQKRRNDKVLFLSNGTLQSVEIQCSLGHTETIEFKTKHFNSLNKVLKFFEKLDLSKSYQVNVKNSCAKNEEQVNENSQPGICPTEEKNLRRGLSKPSSLSSNVQISRYSKVDIREKRAEGITEYGCKVNTAPCMYTLQPSPTSNKAEKNDALYVSSRELSVLRATEQRNFTPCCESLETSDTLNVFHFSNNTASPDADVLEGKVDSRNELSSHSQNSWKPSLLWDVQEPGDCDSGDSVTSGIIAKGAVPIESDYLEAKHRFTPCNNEVQLSIETNDSRSVEDRPISNTADSMFCYGDSSIKDNLLHQNMTLTYHCPVFHEGEFCSHSEPLKASFDEDSFCSQAEPQLSQSERENTVENSKQTLLNIESSKARKSPKGRCSVEEWFPKNLQQEIVPSRRGFVRDEPPPIVARDLTVPLEPRKPLYENMAPVKEDGSKENTFVTKKANGTLICVFANEMDFGGACTIGVIMLQRDDHKTFQQLKELESEFDRNQITPPRSFDFTSDVKISICECSNGFEAIGQQSYVIKYEDIEQLGPSKWIVTEFHCLHDNEECSVFKCDIGVEPAMFAREVQQSHYTSQNISIVRRISRTEIITGRRNTPSPPRSKLPLKTINRQMLCRDLDVPSALGSDWRELAGRIGLDMREIRLIEHGKHDSCTEEVLKILEYRYPHLCSEGFMFETLQDMKRLDLLEYIQ